MQTRTIQDSQETTFEYDSDGDELDDCDLMTEAKSTTGGDNFTLTWDENGNMTGGLGPPRQYNWDNKLRNAIQPPIARIDLKYDPDGNRVWKWSSQLGSRKYVVDIVGDLPVILMEIDPADGSIQKTYIYANSQIIAQHDGDHSAPRYFYLHDRLGSVRQIIDCDGDVVRHYTYKPFGEVLESSHEPQATSNSFLFTGQYYDDEIDEYHLRARQYFPRIARFTSRDPIQGKFEEPLTLHRYLYCRNNPLNRVDPSGLWGDGLRYYLERYKGVQNAHALSDTDIERMFPTIWNEPDIWNTDKRAMWHGHSDFGYLLGDFDYTVWDRPGITHPHFIPIGTYNHFRSLESCEFWVHVALRSGSVEMFQDAMHMGQDYFSHRNEGNYWLTDAVLHALRGHRPDYPYSGRSGRQLSLKFLQAQRWTKQFEEAWYLMWEGMDKWLSLPL